MGNTIKGSTNRPLKSRWFEMLAGVKTVSQICSEYSIHPTQAQTWKAHALGFVEMFHWSVIYQPTSAKRRIYRGAIQTNWKIKVRS